MNFTPMEREEELCRLWESLPAPGFAFSALRGERILLISPGRRNSGPGPDFHGAVLLVDGALRVGPVEMHLRESDWFAHGHQTDPAYDGVVLHVLADEPVPEGMRLSMPAVSARILAEAGRTAARRSRGESDSESEEAEGGKKPEPAAEISRTSGDKVSLNLLAELSWNRLLRRVTEIVRDDEGRSHPHERIRRAFLFRLFDSLGYSGNREPMRAVAKVIVATFFSGSPAPAGGAELLERGAFSFDELAAAVFSSAGIPARRLEKIGRAFVPDERLRKILPATVPQAQADPPQWDYRGRPANAPERRLWGGAKLAFDLLWHNLLEDSLEGIRRKRTFESLLEPFVVRLGGETILGRSRAGEVVVNVLCPVALAAGVLWNDSALTEGACLTYRNASSLASNRIVREVEGRFGGENLKGAFLQQGAIEYYQRVLSPDKSGYSMIAEPPPEHS